MEKVYIGLDPGGDGFVSVIDGEGMEFLAVDGTSLLEMGAFIGRFSGKACMAVLEDVHAVFGSSAKGTFQFGFSKGLLMGLLVAHRIPYALVAPKDWQNAVWVNADKVYSVKKTVQKDGTEKPVKKVDTKATSLNAAMRIFPNVDFRKNEKCRKPHDGKVDSLLIAEYGRRNNL